MFADLVLPNVGFGMEEGRLIAWLKQPGDAVRKGEVVAEVEGDKAAVELEAVVDGVLSEILVQADQTVAVGSVLARIRTDGQAVSVTAPIQTQAASVATSATPQTVASSIAPNISPVARRMAQERGLDLAAVIGSGPGGRITREDVEAHVTRQSSAGNGHGKALAAPAVRKLARDTGIDLSAIRGTGEGGRVTRADVASALAAQHAAPAAAPLPSLTPQPAYDGERTEVPLSNMRQAIARRLTKIVQEAPHFYTTAELDLTDALAALPSGVGVNALLLYLVVQALHDVPDLNATFEDGRLYHYPNVHLAIAVAVPDGLLTPVLRRADDYSLSGLAARAKELIVKTRDGRLKMDDLQGGTFTVSNLGVVQQVERFTAILNPPQVGILAIGAAKERPVVINGGLHIRTTAFATLTADHRIVDGMIAARFLEALDTRIRGFQGG